LIRRTSKILLETVAIVVGGIAVLIGLMAWRLSTGPISLDFVTPYIEDDLVSPDGSYFFKLGNVSLIWSGWSHALTLQADSVEMYRRDGSLITSLPLIEIGISARALLVGDLAPTSLFLIDPKLRLRRDANGTISLGLGDSTAGDEGATSAASDGIKDFVLGLAKGPSRDRPSGFLTSLRIISGNVTVVDDRQGTVWDIPDATILLQRDKLGLRLDLSFELSFDGDLTRVQASGIYNRDLATLVLGVGFNNFAPRQIGERLDGYEYLKWLEVAFDGELSGAVDLAGEVVDISFDVTSGSGRFVNHDYYPNGLDIASIKARGRFTENFDGLELQNFVIDLGGPTLAITGEVSGLRDAPAIDGKVAMRNIPIDRFDAIWPIGVGQGARDWITENISGGMLSSVDATAKLKADDELRNVSVDVLEGTMQINDTTVQYMAGMPAVTGVSGSTKFNAQRFDIFIKEGGIEDLKISSGQIGITKFDDPPEVATIDVDVVGPVTQALELIDNPPLQYAEKMDIDPADVSGNADIALHFQFPLLKAITVDELNPKAEAKISSLKWHHAIEDIDIEDGDLTLDVDEKRMLTDGTVTIAARPVSVEWRQNFDDSETDTSVKVSGTVDDKLLSNAAPKLLDRISGATKVDIAYEERKDGSARIDAKADLTESAISIPEILWSKAVGDPGMADFRIQMKNETVLSVAPISFTSGDMKVRGSLTFAPSSGNLDIIEIDELSTGETKISGKVDLEPGGAITLHITGQALDLTDLMDHWFHDRDDENQEDDETPGDLDIRVELDRLYFNKPEARYVDGLSLSLLRRNNEIRSANAQMRVPTTNDVFGFSIEPTGDMRYLSAATEDAGDVLRVLGVVETVKGGQLSLTGQLEDQVHDQDMSADLKITQFSVVDAPILAQILTLASFKGIVDVLTGQGISFDVLEGQVSSSDGIYTIENGRAHGSALGLTLSGTYDENTDKLDLEGTIVPAYFFNSLLGNIPVIGKLLVGEKGSGVFAASFRITGPRENPDVTVNPLSALLPGVLRNIFSGTPPTAPVESAVYPYGEGGMSSKK
jgi:hypothetical protein